MRKRVIVPNIPSQWSTTGTFIYLWSGESNSSSISGVEVSTYPRLAKFSASGISLLGGEIFTSVALLPKWIIIDSPLL